MLNAARMCADDMLVLVYVCQEPVSCKEVYIIFFRPEKGSSGGVRKGVGRGLIPFRVSVARLLQICSVERTAGDLYEVGYCLLCVNWIY